MKPWIKRRKMLKPLKLRKKSLQIRMIKTEKRKKTEKTERMIKMEKAPNQRRLVANQRKKRSNKITFTTMA
jgi:hypothetical protein